jgi:hypothetical protein
LGFGGTVFAGQGGHPLAKTLMTRPLRFAQHRISLYLETMRKLVLSSALALLMTVTIGSPVKASEKLINAYVQEALLDDPEISSAELKLATRTVAKVPRLAISQAELYCAVRKAGGSKRNSAQEVVDSIQALANRKEISRQFAIAALQIGQYSVKYADLNSCRL